MKKQRVWDKNALRHLVQIALKNKRNHRSLRPSLASLREQGNRCREKSEQKVSNWFVTSCRPYTKTCTMPNLRQQRYRDKSGVICLI